MCIRDRVKYVWKQKLKGNKRYPLVLMLEPLFRCNLACAGCGKVQYPPHILKKQLTPEECFAAVEECGVPMVSIPGGEPLLHPQIVEIVNGLIARKKYIYLCTNALELKKRIHEFTPSKYLTFSVHLDGQRDHHDFSVCREGGYDIAIEGIKEAVKRGFRVTPNSTFFDGTDPNSVRAYFDEIMAIGVEGMVLSPGYSYDKAPDQTLSLIHIYCGCDLIANGSFHGAISLSFWTGFCTLRRECTCGPCVRWRSNAQKRGCWSASR